MQFSLRIFLNLSNCLKVTGIINNVFRPQETVRKTRIKLYNTLALPALLYDSETLTIKQETQEE
jgi:hypothetical protein